MPEPLIHFVIPFIVLSFCGLTIKKSLILSSIAILPDLDVLFHIHRSVTHSAVFLILVCIPIIGFIKLKYPNYFHDSLVGTLVVLTHPILDVFHAYTPILYPLYKNSVFIVCKLVMDMSSISDLRFFFEIKVAPTYFSLILPNTDGVVFSSLGIGISLVIFVGIITKWVIKNGNNKKR
jgi:membrane-bound metal-dependent hydrolase YbcI (DUF457 family)